MPNPGPDNPNDRFERWLDGALDDDASAEVAREVEADPALGAERAVQGRIDDALGRLFAAPEFDLLPAEAPSVDRAPAPAEPAATRKTPLTQYALAASLLVACGLLWWRQAALIQNEAADAYVTRDAGTVFLAAVDDGFKPDWRCEDDKRFAETFAERQGQPLWLAPLPVGSSMLGLAYLDNFTERGTAMMARVDGEPVLVLVDRADRVPRAAKRAKQPGVAVHQRELGPLTLIEVSRFDAPRVAPSLELIDSVPAEDTGRVPGDPVDAAE